MSRKNYTAIRIRKQLERAARQAGLGVPLQVSADFWAHMRSNIRKETSTEKRVEYQKVGVAGRWGGRVVFIVSGCPNEPLPYPHGDEALKAVETEQRGGEPISDDEADRWLDEYGIE